MVWIFFIIALIAGVCLLPEKELQKIGVIIPDQARLKRIWQIMVFVALVFAMLTLRLAPFALLLALVGVGVVANSIWQERAMEADLQDRVDINSGTYPPPPVRQGKMTIEEAYAVLGLSPDVTILEVDTTYRHLISQIHPDKGGTDYLAAKINEARDILKKHLSKA